MLVSLEEFKKKFRKVEGFDILIDITLIGVLGIPEAKFMINQYPDERSIPDDANLNSTINDYINPYIRDNLHMQAYDQNKQCILKFIVETHILNGNGEIEL